MNNPGSGDVWDTRRGLYTKPLGQAYIERDERDENLRSFLEIISDFPRAVVGAVPVL